MNLARYSKLKSLIDEQERFPTRFVVKFIGKNSAPFEKGVQRFEGGFPGLSRQSRRESSGGGHVALTYQLEAHSSDEIVHVLQSVARIDDVMMVL